MNGGKGKTFWLKAQKPKIGDWFPPPPIQANVKLRLTQGPKPQNRRLISSPSHTSKCKIETYWLKHFFPFIFSFHSKSEPMNICPCSPLGNKLIFLLLCIHFISSSTKEKAVWVSFVKWGNVFRTQSCHENEEVFCALVSRGYILNHQNTNRTKFS